MPADLPLPRVESTPIEGLLVVRLDLREDDRGWFKENWQRAKMVPAGLPDFGPVQHNLSFNTERGVARGFHAEPWDKYLTIAHGRVFAAWVDMREGPTFGATFSMEMGTDVGVFVPRGVANSYQTLTDAATYSYLVNQHWRPDAAYPGVALSDPALGIEWPIPLDECVLSEKDLGYGPLTSEMAIGRQRMLVLGGDGQVGRALAAEFPDAVVVGRDVLDVTDSDAVAAWDWRAHDVVVNAAAYTAVDAAETDEGRRAAWAANATAPGRLAALAREHGFTLVHFSSDYVLSGAAPEDGWSEDDALAPTSVYGHSKAAGDLAVAAAPHHYILRCSWVVGEGANFVATMCGLAQRGISPTVVDDQIGRPTFATEMARAVRHLLATRPAYGTYHLSGAGDSVSFHALAQEIFTACGRDTDDVVPVSTATYAAGRDTVTAPRPADSRLDLSKIRATGFEPRGWRESLAEHLARS